MLVERDMAHHTGNSPDTWLACAFPSRWRHPRSSLVPSPFSYLDLPPEPRQGASGQGPSALGKNPEAPEQPDSVSSAHSGLEGEGRELASVKGLLLLGAGEILAYFISLHF